MVLAGEGCSAGGMSVGVVVYDLGISGAVTQGKRAPDFFPPYNEKCQDSHHSLHSKYCSEKTL